MPRVTVVSIPQELPEETDQLSLRQKSYHWQKELRDISWRELLGKWLTKNNGVACMLGFLLSRVVLLGELDSIGIAFFAALYRWLPVQARFAGIGVIVGEASLGRWEAAVAYSVAIVAYQHYASKGTRREKTVGRQMFLLFMIVCASRLLVQVTHSFAVYDIFLISINAALGSLLYYVLQISLESDERTGENGVSAEAVIAKLVLVALALGGIGSVTIYGYELRNILGSFWGLLMALYGGAGPGAVIGVTAGVVIGLAGGDAARFIAALATAGMIGGAVYQAGKYAVAFAYLLGYSLVLLILGQAIDNTAWMMEVSAACLLFLVCPERYGIIWGQVISGGQVKRQKRSTSLVLSKKIEQLALLFSDMGQAFGQLSGKNKSEIKEYETQVLLAQVGEKICQDCSKRTCCWGDFFYQSYEALLELAAQVERGEKGMPRQFKQHCIKSQELASEVIKVTEENQAYFYWQTKVYDTRQLANEQMKAISAILQNLHGELEREPKQDRILAKKLMEKAAQLSCPLHSVDIAILDAARTFFIRKRPCAGNEECRHTLLPLASGLSGEILCLSAKCGSKENKELCQITLKTVEKLKVNVGYASLAQKPGEGSGDHHSIMNLMEGKSVLILSDGMGTGKEAGQESTMAVQFLERLLAVGFAVDVAVKTVNAMLIAQKAGESFPTIDMAVLDSYSGETDFIKIGAAPSYVKRVREVTTIQYCSAMIGMVDQKKIQPVTVQLTKDDIIVLISDGISDSGAGEREDWVANFLRRLTVDRPQEIAESLLAEARRRSGCKVKDDMTVLVARLEQVKE